MCEYLVVGLVDDCCEVDLVVGYGDVCDVYCLDLICLFDFYVFE